MGFMNAVALYCVYNAGVTVPFISVMYDVLNHL